MTRFLHRPMFRRGGSTGGGITSGLEPKRGLVDEPGKYSQDSDFFEGYEEAKKRRDKELGPYPKGTSDADFWLNWGTNILAQPGGRPILQTLGTAAQTPLKQLQQQKAMERHGKREEDRDFLDTWMANKAKILAEREGASGNEYSHQSQISIGLAALDKKTVHNELWNPAWKDPSSLSEEEAAKRSDWIIKRKKIQFEIDQVNKEEGVDVEALVNAEGGYDNLKRGNKKLLIESEEMMIDPHTGTEVEVSEYYTTLHPEELEKRILEMTQDQIQELIRRKQGWTYTGKKEGGRAGYAGGELVEQEDVNVMTPQGDVAMQETVEEGEEPDQLSYEELRSRLPSEITDDIIRLLTNSAAALGDFAEIQTQVDVDNFNAKYGVNLVLPSEA